MDYKEDQNGTTIPGQTVLECSRYRRYNSPFTVWHTAHYHVVYVFITSKITDLPRPASVTWRADLIWSTDPMSVRSQHCCLIRTPSQRAITPVIKTILF